MIIEFPSSKAAKGLLLSKSKPSGPSFQSGRPDYFGRTICLNPERSQVFQCGGFVLGPRRPSAVVPENSNMVAIHAAVLAGALLDITDREDIQSENSGLGGVNEGNTGKKAYVSRTADGFMSIIGVDDPEVQKEFDQQIANKSRLVLPPGMDDPDRYLLKFQKDEIKPAVKKSARKPRKVKVSE